jgi:hypothetical protein
MKLLKHQVLEKASELAYAVMIKMIVFIHGSVDHVEDAT